MTVYHCSKIIGSHTTGRLFKCRHFLANDLLLFWRPSDCSAGRHCRYFVLLQLAFISDASEEIVTYDDTCGRQSKLYFWFREYLMHSKYI